MAWHWTAPAADEIAAPLKPGPSGTSLALSNGNGSGILQHRSALSPLGPVKLCSPGYVPGGIMELLHGGQAAGENKEEESAWT